MVTWPHNVVQNKFLLSSGGNSLYTFFINLLRLSSYVISCQNQILWATFFVTDSMGLTPTTMMYLVIKFSQIKQNNNHYATHQVTNFDTNGKPVCDFLLVNSTNLYPVLQHFKDIAITGPIFSATDGCHSLTHSFRVNP